jgi:diguanylate cyclase (GGDEF)-like protein
MTPVEVPCQAASETGCLLVVDDEEDIVRIFRQFLEEKGYQVDSCFNGMEACAKIRSRFYDLVITDMVMSPVRGEEILRAVTEHSPDTEVIVVTAFATFERIQEALRRQVFDFVEKPVDLHALSSVVSSAVAKARESQSRRRLLSELRERNAQLVEEVQRATQNLERDALEDTTTGLPGYQAFRSTLETEISRSIQSSIPLTLGMFHVGSITELNRSHGREKGGTFLRRLADVLRGSLRKSDVLFRYGTDQFAVVFLGSSSDAALKATDRLIRQTDEGARESMPEAPDLDLNLAAGLASIPRDGGNFDQLVRAANQALEVAKQGDHHRVHQA